MSVGVCVCLCVCLCACECVCACVCVCSGDAVCRRESIGVPPAYVGQHTPLSWNPAAQKSMAGDKCIHICICGFVDIYIYICIYDECVFIYISMYMDTSIRMYVCVYQCIYVSLY